VTANLESESSSTSSGNTKRMNKRLLFQIGIAIKGFDSLLEIAGGVLLLMPVQLNEIIMKISQHELLVSPEHHTVKHIERTAVELLERATVFNAIFLMVHGLAKAVLIWGVLKQKKWGYVGLLWVLSIFTGAELVRAAMVHALHLFLFAAIDISIIVVIAMDYRSEKKKGRFSG
jgi:uncharacterized membrane protein